MKANDTGCCPSAGAVGENHSGYKDNICKILRKSKIKTAEKIYLFPSTL